MDHLEIVEKYKYDDETGAIFRPTGRGGFKLCGSLAPNGYIKVSINGKLYFAHRFVWFYVHGVWPKGQIDHINGNKIDNRIENLREATHSENQQNRSNPPRHSSSKYLGVSWNYQQMKWRAQLVVNKLRVLDEYFDSEEDARDRYICVKRLNHPFGRI